MFIVSIFGGLASQMNQYAFSRFLARRYPGSEIRIFDGTDYLPGDRHCGYEIDRVFGLRKDDIDLKVINRLSRFYFGKGKYARCRDFLRRVKNRIIGPTASHITESDPTVPSDRLCSLDPARDYFFWSNFANDFYDTPELAAEVAKCFRFPALPESAQAVAREIANTESVAIHIRRGDYQACGFPLLGDDYYRRAIDILLPKLSSAPHFFVFSDDMEAARETLSFLKAPTTYVSDFRGADSYVDMQLMSVCRHNINANSGFSYWGARLNPNPGKIVIAPARHVPWCQRPNASKGWILV